MKKKPKKTAKPKAAKKKRKPKAGRAKRGATRTVRITELSEAEKRAMLYSKIECVRKALPQIEATGRERDPDGDEEICYTEAHHVFEQYQKVFDEVGLIVRPCEDYPEIHINGGVVIVTMFFEIADPSTGYFLKGAGIGMGANRDWSGNTAQTRALKQFLLTSFGAFWRDPEQQRRMDAKIIKQEVADQLAPGLKLVAEEVKDYFSQYFQKGKVTDGSKRGRKPDTGDSAGKEGAGN